MSIKDIISNLRKYAQQENVEYLIEDFKELDKNIYLKDKQCQKCINYKTMDCPNSSECFTTNNKPYFMGSKEETE